VPVLNLDEGVEPLEVVVDGRRVPVTHPADLSPEVMDRFAALGGVDEDEISFSESLAEEMRVVARLVAPELPASLSFMRVVRFLKWYGDVMARYLDDLPPKEEAGPSRPRPSRARSRR